MEILFVSSEVAPWSKTGGLGDVAGALPRALAARGHQVTVVTPRYHAIDVQKEGLRPAGHELVIRGQRVSLWVKEEGARVFFVEHDPYFGSRLGPYGDKLGEYGDNAERFALLVRVALALPGELGFRPHIVHGNDWQTGLIPYVLRREHATDRALSRARSVFTIHNLAYQGVFPKAVVPALGLPWDVFRYQSMEFWDQLSFMKAGLTGSDALTTVSPTYAREILTPEGGAHMDAVLRHRGRDLTGILNGIDTAEWNPATDPHLAAPFSPEDLAGKATNKAAVQRELGLPVRPDVPLVGMVGRLAEQKGIDLVSAVLPALLQADVQLVLLGSGDPGYQDLLRQAAAAQPQKMAVRIGFDEGLAHRIEAGGDVFLMPSRFEPCGLNQMYSLRYGTVPVVRAVGGLEDTVEDYDGAGAGTGFKFRQYTPDALMTALRRALDLYRDRRAWRGLMLRGMAEDNSWERSAASYEQIYRKLAG
ncbi:MAG: glycogen synthase GlgA [Anaeromyxobacter sp.]